MKQPLAHISKIISSSVSVSIIIAGTAVANATLLNRGVGSQLAATQAQTAAEVDGTLETFPPAGTTQSGTQANPSVVSRYTRGSAVDTRTTTPQLVADANAPAAVVPATTQSPAVQQTSLPVQPTVPPAGQVYAPVVSPATSSASSTTSSSTTSSSTTSSSTTSTTILRTTTTTTPSSSLPAGFKIPEGWNKPIPPIPAGCRKGQLEDNGVWNCEH